ncbi:MAG TPA: hypothetical protein VJ835_08835 [Fimbriimonadaceae bacterium]|nr:hypothetical protein [Fimbriimonadaceae bacterium]
MKWLVRFVRVAVFRIKRLFETQTLFPSFPTPGVSLPPETKEHVPDVLMDLGPLGSRAAQMARAHELGMAYVDLHRIKIDDSVRSLVPLSTLLEHQVLPLKCSDDCLWLACSDLEDLGAFETIRSLTGLKVIPVLALAEVIDDMLHKRILSIDA